jgi:DNA-binding CsgD family transcriptional regulator
MTIGHPQGVRRSTTPKTPKLTYRQSQFLALTASGLKYDQIAVECFVSPKTVQEILREARSRLSARTTSHAIVLAIAYELLILDHDGNVSPPDSVNADFEPGFNSASAAHARALQLSVASVS